MANRFASFDSHVAGVENRLTQIENKFDTRFDDPLGRVIAIDDRFTWIEE